MIVPQKWTQEILEMVHDDLQSGHFGIHKTTARVQNRFFWLGYKQDIMKHIQNCQVCNSRKPPSRRTRSKMKQYNVGAPLERVALDLIGPLPFSYKGNKYALIVSHYFTRWAEGYPLPNIEDQTVAESQILYVDLAFHVNYIPIKVDSSSQKTFQGVMRETPHS